MVVVVVMLLLLLQIWRKGDQSTLVKN